MRNLAFSSLFMEKTVFSQMASACDNVMPLQSKELCSFSRQNFFQLVFFIFYHDSYVYFLFCFIEIENIHIIIDHKLLFATQPKSVC